MEDKFFSTFNLLGKVLCSPVPLLGKGVAMFSMIKINDY